VRSVRDRSETPTPIMPMGVALLVMSVSAIVYLIGSVVG